MVMVSKLLHYLVRPICPKRTVTKEAFIPHFSKWC